MSDLPLINALGCAVGIDDADLPAEHGAEIRRAWTGAASQLGDPLPVAHLTVTPARGPVAESLSSLSQSVTLAAIEAHGGAEGGLHGVSMRRFVGGLDLRPVAARGSEAQDIDSWADLALLDPTTSTEPTTSTDPTVATETR